MEKDEKIFNFCYFTATVLSIIVLEIAQFLLIRHRSNNLKIYAALLCIMCVSFAFMYFVSYKLYRIPLLSVLYDRGGKIFFIITLGLLLTLLVKYFFKGLGFYGGEGWNVFPKRVSLIAVGFLFAILLPSLLRKPCEHKWQMLACYMLFPDIIQMCFMQILMIPMHIVLLFLVWPKIFLIP